jgi:hypothetical protein
LKTEASIQIGFPKLAKAGSDRFFELLRLWVQDCEANHPNCHNASVPVLPTRLLDVGTIASPRIRLIETQKEDLSITTYIALSHMWGGTYSLYTTTGNLRDLMDYVPDSQIPQTFKDAIICTRALGIRYLWVDALCIIYGADGDFRTEAPRMEGVFSGAYCTLAASRASDSHSGFLGPRPECDAVIFQRDTEERFYVSKSVDNFQGDIIEGALNRRAWVLQERALARRTIYFAENQAYFECGEGIRCETLTKMHK